MPSDINALKNLNEGLREFRISQSVITDCDFASP